MTLQFKNSSQRKSETLSDSNSNLNISNNGSKVCHFPSTSRYGRTIKPKSPGIPKSASIKNEKTPLAEDKQEDVSVKIDTSLDIFEDSFNATEDFEKREIKLENEEECKEIESPWLPGQLLWARMSKYPYWPSIVSPDPESKKIVMQKGRSKHIFNMVHITFCADKGRHNWVTFSNVMPFTGKANFEKLSSEMASDVKRKDSKKAAGFFINSTMKAQWEKAVEDATELMGISIEKRNDYYNSKIKKEIQKITENNKKKRLSTMLEDDKIKKRKTSEDSEGQVVIQNNLNLDSPPTPPSSGKDSSDETTPQLNNKHRNISEDGPVQDRCFRTFCERHKDAITDMEPDANQADINTFLFDMWKGLSPKQRNKYKADYMSGDDEEVEVTFDVETTSVESDKIFNNKKRKSKARRELSDQDDTTSVESEPVPEKKQNAKGETNFDFIMDLSRRRSYRLFKGMKNERICQICLKPGTLIRCKGPCHSYFHLQCVTSEEPTSEASDSEEQSNYAYKEDLKEIKEKIKEQQKKTNGVIDEDNFKCFDCLSGVAPPCFICNGREGERVKCTMLTCGKHYHRQCLDTWPQSHWQGDRPMCPYHVCHTCVSDHPEDDYPRGTSEKLVRCIKCPTSYHTTANCVPAGSSILTALYIICPKHYKTPHPPVNTTWCFLCTKGGSLICCDSCPMSFHLECLGIQAPEGDFICEDCETGRLPLYGEVVWVKLGHYRWWPAVICFPQEIPERIAALPHTTGEFCVIFLGTRDYYWVHRGRVFLFQDGDANLKVVGSKKVEDSYRKAIQEADIYYNNFIIEKAATDKKSQDIRPLKPPPYIKLRVNKPVGNVKVPEMDSLVPCSCDPRKPNPCSRESDCLNRLLMFECSPDTCPAGTKCQNQLFVQRKYPALEPVYTAERGWGLKTLEPIKEGQFVIEYVGEIIDETEFKIRLEQKRERKNQNYYFLTIDNNRIIDAEPKGNLSRFMNHSCQPNCETQKWTVNGDTRIGLFALQDIESGEELTFNYNLACDGETKRKCLCKAPNCSGYIGLKAIKPQNNVSQEKRIEKNEKNKRKKHKKIQICWNCSEPIDNNDDKRECHQKTCKKIYHADCIVIESDSGDRQLNEQFHCPWHFCAECGKRTTIKCSFCCNSFCSEHVEGSLKFCNQTGNNVCYKHLMNDQLSNSENVGEALMDIDGDCDDEEDDNDEENDENYDDMMPTNSLLEDERQNDEEETSPRGAIVEIRPSSGEEDDSGQLNDSFLDGTTILKSKICSTPKKRQTLNNESSAKQSLTLDEIAAIIGIEKEGTS